jgi:hypothetical protein
LSLNDGGGSSKEENEDEEYLLGPVPWIYS